jgi:hypothetical protein
MGRRSTLVAAVLARALRWPRKFYVKLLYRHIPPAQQGDDVAREASLQVTRPERAGWQAKSEDALGIATAHRSVTRLAFKSFDPGRS